MTISDFLALSAQLPAAIAFFLVQIRRLRYCDNTEEEGIIRKGILD
jgi:hypothetical protein